MTESDFIALLRTLPLHPGARGLRDDAAVLEIGGEALVLTHDMIAEDVHYLPSTDPFDIAWKLVAVNLSDLAAKGAVPVGVMIGASLTDGAERFVAGLHAILAEYGVPLLGGDTIRPAGPASFGCTAIGRATTRPVPSRAGARAGDGVYLIGAIGRARRGFLQLTEGRYPDEPDSVAAYLRPRPLLAEGRRWAAVASAMMDVSDGLLLDLARMAAASGVTIDVSAPPSPPDDDPLAAMTWGDDYALVAAAAVPPAGGSAPAPIGRVLPRGAHAILLDGRPISGPLGYQH